MPLLDIVDEAALESVEYGPSEEKGEQGDAESKNQEVQPRRGSLLEGGSERFEKRVHGIDI